MNLYVKVCCIYQRIRFGSGEAEGKKAEKILCKSNAWLCMYENDLLIAFAVHRMLAAHSEHYVSVRCMLYIHRYIHIYIYIFAT